MRPLLLLVGADRVVREGLLRCTRDGELRVVDRCGADRRMDVLERVELLRCGAARPLLLLEDGRA